MHSSFPSYITIYVRQDTFLQNHETGKICHVHYQPKHSSVCTCTLPGQKSRVERGESCCLAESEYTRLREAGGWPAQKHLNSDPGLWISLHQYPHHWWTAGVHEVDFLKQIQMLGSPLYRGEIDYLRGGPVSFQHLGSGRIKYQKTEAPMKLKSHYNEYLQTKMYGPNGIWWDKLWHSIESSIRWLFFLWVLA